MSGKEVIGGLLQFIVVQAGPLVYLTRRSLLWRKGVAGEKEWYPLGNALLGLTFYFSVLYLALSVMGALQAEWLQNAFEQELPKHLADMEPDQAKIMVESRVDRHIIIYIALGIAAWVWMLVMYATAACANMVLGMYKKNIRPSYALKQFTIPSWVFALVGICAVASAVGGGEIGYISKTLLITLLFPYFLSGMCYIHDRLVGSPFRPFALVMLYAVLLPLVWPAVFIILVGMAYQCKLLKPLPGIKNFKLLKD